jgi:hypothetical protein
MRSRQHTLAVVVSRLLVCNVGLNVGYDSGTTTIPRVLARHQAYDSGQGEREYRPKSLSIVVAECHAQTLPIVPR